MDMLATKLKESRSRLFAQGSAFFASTRGAGEALAKGTMDAATSFATTTRTASASFMEATRGAGLDLFESVRTEAELWRDFIASQALVKPDLRLPVMDARGVQKQILTRLKGTLSDLGGRVDERLEDLEEAPKLPGNKPKARAPKKKAAKKLSEKSANGAPIKGYDKLTAKAIVQRLAKLSATEVAAVIEYEKAHKARATILKAAEKHAA